MALIENYINDNGQMVERNKIKLAIERIKNFYPLALSKNSDGYYVCDSGGKDSEVITKLMYLTKCLYPDLKYTIHHNHTTCDRPETVKYVKRMKTFWELTGIEYTIHKPTYNGEPTSMWKLISERGLPTRLRRWCCRILKEGGGIGYCIVLGVRWAESVKRKNRAMVEAISKNKQEKLYRNNDNDETRQLFETCTAYDKYSIAPIIDWSDDDVWSFLKMSKSLICKILMLDANSTKWTIEHNPLYDKGYKRVGCVGCPLSSNFGQELEKNPKYKSLYLSAIKRFMRKKSFSNIGWKDEHDMYNWWVSGNSLPNQNQLTIEDYSFEGVDE